MYSFYFTAQQRRELLLPPAIYIFLREYEYGDVIGQTDLSTTPSSSEKGVLERAELHGLKAT